MFYRVSEPFDKAGKENTRDVAKVTQGNFIV